MDLTVPMKAQDLPLKRKEQANYACFTTQARLTWPATTPPTERSQAGCP